MSGGYLGKLSGGKVSNADAGHYMGNIYVSAGTEMYKRAQALKKDAKKNKAGQAKLQRQINEMMGTRPEYKGIQNDDGWLSSRYKMQEVDYDSNLSGLNKRLGAIGDVNAGSNFSDAQGNVVYLQDQAYSDAPTEWANRQLEYQDLLDQGSREDLLKNNDRARESAYSQLAMRGGLDSGARERMAESFGTNLTEQQQLQNRENNLAKLGVRTSDEANKMSLARDLPGMNLQLDSYNTGLQDANRQADFAKTNAWSNMATHESDQKMNEAINRMQFNRTAAIQNNMNMNNANLDGWNSQMQAFAAGKSGDAMSKAGDKKSSTPFSKAMFG